MKNSLRILTSLFAIVCLFALCTQNLSAQTIEEGEWGYTEYDLDTTPFDKNQPLKPSIVAAPNPSTGGILKVWFSKLTEESVLTVFDLAGKEYRRVSVGSPRISEGVYNLRTQDLSPGMYLVKLKSGVHEAFQKVFIQN